MVWGWNWCSKNQFIPSPSPGLALAQINMWGSHINVQNNWGFAEQYDGGAGDGRCHRHYRGQRQCPPPDTHVMVRDTTMPLSPPTNDSDDDEKSVTLCQINDMLPT